MDIENLRSNYPKLITYMEESGYCKAYVERVRQEINRILSKASIKGWASYADIYLEYTKTSSSKNYLHERLTILGAIESFDVQGQYPNGRKRQRLVKRGTYHLLQPDFKTVIDNYCKFERLRGKKEASIYCESHSAASFFLTIQQSGINAVGEITEDAVLSVFLAEDGRLCRSYAYKKNIAAVLRAYTSESPEIVDKILSYLPEIRQSRKNIQYLKPDEAALVKQALKGKKPDLSQRDRAIGTLAFYTGLRCCDIAALKANDIDWKKELIRIRQQKTGVPLELPLTVTVGNALYDYITSERPNTGCEYVFISECRPYGRLSERGIAGIAAKIMKAAHIRQNPGDRGGFHIFRHRVATELLSNGVPQPVISKTLGHASPVSLESYLSADFTHLKECALSIEQFPVAKGVFVDA